MPDWVSVSGMKELIQNLVDKADLTPEQAAKVAEVVRNFLGERLPEPIKGPVTAWLSGDKVETAVDKAKDLLGGLLG